MNRLLTFLLLFLCCFSTTANAYEYNDVLLVDSFDHEVMFNMLGGKTQGDEESEGGCFPTFAGADDNAFGNNNCSLKLDYDVTFPGTFSFYTSRLGMSGIDMSEYNYISFWFYPTEKNMDFSLEIHQDIDGDGDFMFGVDHVDKLFLGRFTRNAEPGKWQKIVVPLKFFRKMPKWDSIVEIIFLFEHSRRSGAGILYIDDVVLGTNYPTNDELENNRFQSSIKVDTFELNSNPVSGIVELKTENTINMIIKDSSARLEAVYIEYRQSLSDPWVRICSFFDHKTGIYNEEIYLDEELTGQMRLLAVSSEGSVYERKF